MTLPIVTALRVSGPGRVAVELDGRPWRVVPLEAVYAVGLAVGNTLDRQTSRRLNRELRRLDARARALRALRAREHTVASLDRHLAAGGTSASVRREAVAAAQRAGLVDDARYAAGRADLLARRGAGDLMIADDLARSGVASEVARLAIGRLEPERERAAAIVRSRGLSPKIARQLAAKGFSEVTLEPFVAELTADRVG